MILVGVSLLLVVVYTYAGYPLLVALWARLAPYRVVPQQGFEPSVSVCLSVHNGEKFLAQKLASLQALDYPPRLLEVLIYCDGSTDGTVELAQMLAQATARVRVFANPERLGKPSGLNRLRAEASGEVLLMTDVRQTLSPGALRALLVPLSDPTIGCVSGSLVLAGSSGAGAYWRYEKFIRGSEARLGSMVGVSGSLYAIRRSDLQPLPSDVLLDDMFVPLLVAGAHKRVVLSPTAEAYDEAYDDEQEFARKVRTLAGNYQLLAKLPWLLIPFRNPLWLQVVSHKLLRLLCPFALLGLLLVSLMLALSPGAGRQPWQLLAVGQLVFYAVALLGARAGRVGALARTFVVLNAAAVVGLWRFLRGTQHVAW
jgi:cellulose synthase/poly-beta-1,6-N-acetylglucosamine synthase-like glycosyltransferase